MLELFEELFAFLIFCIFAVFALIAFDSLFLYGLLGGRW